MPTDPVQISGPDSVLLEFLGESDESAADSKLARLIDSHARPLIQTIIRSTVRFSPESGTGQAADLDDIYGDAITRLLIGLRRLRSTGSRESIDNFRSYVAVTAYNCCYSYLRAKYPGRWKLKDRVQYALRNQKGFAVWEGGAREWLCGFGVWRDERRPRADAGWVRRVRDNRALASAPETGKTAAGLLSALKSVFDQVQGPVSLDELVTVLAEAWGISDQEVRLDTHDPARCTFYGAIASRSNQEDSALETSVHLERLWREICALPQRQRAALLLGLDDRHGRDAITLFTNARVASLRQIADALEMGAEELAALSNGLPLDDLTIATRLGATRQQVINLRKAARRRLTRRVASNE